MKIFAAVLIAALAAVGCHGAVRHDVVAATSSHHARGNMPTPNVERYRVAVGNSPQKGSDKALVTIVEFSDFQCPFCARVEPTLDRIRKTYGDEVRLVWKDNPLPFHENAMPAARLARYANSQGKFWLIHDKLFAHPDALDADALKRYANESGIDMRELDALGEANPVATAIAADMADAAALGARGTPSFFINGRPLTGAQPFEAFAAIIDEELANADAALQHGVAAVDVYAALTKDAKLKNSATVADQNIADTALYQVPIGSSPTRGPDTAKVTIVEFADFQCPFCARAETTLLALQKKYGNDVRVVWKNNPLPFHEHAKAAALAGEAALAQGKFWPLHDALFAQQTVALDDESLQEHATRAGLNLAAFKIARGGVNASKRVEVDMALARQLGALGTPTFFVNGKKLVGAQPAEAFEAAIAQAIEKANAAIEHGVPLSALYATLTKDGLVRAKSGDDESDDGGPVRVLIGDAPVRGRKDARVTIVEFSDFECPFCARAQEALARVREAYRRTARIVFKQLPLPFHEHAHLAAEASLAAKAQGKFWQMHDKLFAHKKGLERAALEGYARDIGLDVARFKHALDENTFAAAVDKDLAQAMALGAHATPTFFINGKKAVGAQPYEVLGPKIETALQQSYAIAKINAPTAKLYDTIMATAKVPAPPVGDDEANEAEPDPTRIFTVEAKGPALGPTNAPVTIVEFSDFQCPFCARVMPTIKALRDHYGDRLRIVFRNYPLPFHADAPRAAEAALAANAQGKFWQMHDVLFDHQDALDRAQLEKYAADLGLDVAKFKHALDEHTYAQAVADDVAAANALGIPMGTPLFFVNGHMLSGAQPLPEFARIIDAELAKTR